MRSCQRTVLIILWSFGVWSKLERWRKLLSGNLMSWPKTKKSSFWSVISSYSTQWQRTIPWSYVTHMYIPRSHVTKIGLYMTTGCNQFSGQTVKKLQRTSKAKLAPKNGHGLSFVVCCQFDALQLSESQWNHYIWEVCSANQCLQLTLVSRKGPVLLHNNASKVEQNWAVKFCLIFHTHLTSRQLITTSKHLNNFLQGKWFHNQQDTENAFQGFIKCTGFYTTGINLFLIGKKCNNCNGSYFDS